MSEPTSTTVTGAALVGAAIGAAGPLLGPYLVMAVFAFGGSLVSLGASTTRGLLPSALFVLRGVFLGLAFGGLLADWAASLGWASAHSFIAPGSALIGAVADKWTRVRDIFIRRTDKQP